MKPLKVCVLSSEIVPYAKTGGLADVAGALLGELAKLGHDARAFMPLYATAAVDRSTLEPVPGIRDAEMSIGSTSYRYSLRAGRLPETGALVYFVDCPPLFDRPTLYTTDADEHRRFLLFTRAALESCRRLRFAPDIFHCNDWHTAFLPLYLRTHFADVAECHEARSVFTIHNIGYQGVMSLDALGDLDLKSSERLLDAADRASGVINPLKTGLKMADVVTTVSPTYAREITDTALGMGMQRTLRERSNAVVGILNGVDYREWDPRHDPHLTKHFSADDFAGKRFNKRRLIEATGLVTAAHEPLLSMVTRLAEQKGIDLLFDALPALLAARAFGLVVLGSGERRYVEFFEALARKFPGRVAFRDGFDEPLAHLIEAGSDMFLMPSRYEPCGLNQMYSLRYGTVPIVRNTGGLADTVRHFDPHTRAGTGCVFNDYDAPAVRWGVNTALDWYDDSALWTALMKNGMAEDFSWGRQVLKYEALYREVSAPGRARSA